MPKSNSDFDAVVVGSGPNGLAAAIHLARSGQRVCVLERNETPGGGVRTEQGSPGFYHDVCSSVYPMVRCSPFLKTLNLESFGLEYCDAPIPLAHPLDDGSAAVMHQSVERTAEQFIRSDARAYRRLFKPLVKHADAIFADLMAPPQLPKAPIASAIFGVSALAPSTWTARSRFRSEAARALFAGNAAHSILPLDRPLTTSAIGMMLMLAGHRAGWPFAKGGAASITHALIQCLESHGGKIVCDTDVQSIDDLPKANAYLFDTSPKALAAIAGEQLPIPYQQRLQRFRHGPGVFKVDYALSEPVPWTAADCRQAGTIHVGGTLDEIATSERVCWQEQHSQKPFVLVTQPSIFDPTRAPVGKHVLWAYCHVPSGSDYDMTEAIENQIERFAPGFKDIIISKTSRNSRQLEQYNPNYIGGDIIGGVTDWRQLLTRPVARLRPHTTPASHLFLCSASTPPGAGVHGMCGYFAAREALQVLS